MRYNAGSELYTQYLAHGLAKKNIEVKVFSRIENPFQPDYAIKEEKDIVSANLNIPVILVNVARQKDRYQSDGVDKCFKEVMLDFKPQIVHLNHLNHLSLGIIKVAKDFDARVIFTLHDFWLACPRGQFLQINYEDPHPWQLCDGQEDEKCATRCYSRYFSGLEEYSNEDIQYWKHWVSNRQIKIKKIIDHVDLFISPSQSLLVIMQQELDLDNQKLVYLDYGFDLERLKGRNRIIENGVTFGYIGTHVMAKGIHQLIAAFSELIGDAKLKIWGRERPDITSFLKELVEDIDSPIKLSISWEQEYKNEDIVDEVFNHLDVLVVPSIWNENSPLVIHEALQCRVPVITANIGGMEEYVKDGVNGKLFLHRDYQSLKEKMQFFLDNPKQIEILGKRGYIQSEDGNIPSLEEHIASVLQLYKKLIEVKLKK